MKNNIKTFVIVFVFSIFSMTTFAANTIDDEDLATFVNPGDPASDPGATPINDYLIPMLLIGIFIGYRLLKQKKQLAK